MILFSSNHESLRLLQVKVLVQVSIQKRRHHIHLVNILALDSGNDNHESQ